MSERILIVDDAPANILVLSKILVDHRYQISAVTSGRQALEALDRLRPNLILLDVMMPELDGFEVCRQIKAAPEWRDIPIIFLTSRFGTEDIVRGFGAGAVDYLTKPFEPLELLARVSTHLSIAKLNRENRELLLNVFPGPIADRLKQRPEIVADAFDDVSVLFADIVGFTSLSARLTPTALIERLNLVFSGFDAIVDLHGIEKIKTIGDAYMAAGGLVASTPDHLEAIANSALAMLDFVRELSGTLDGLRIRIGLHTGPVTAGVIGARRFSYDIWGDCVNVARRLESQGVPDRVHVSRDVVSRLNDRFFFEENGEIELKGRGSAQTFFLVRSI
jgi:adenylate cyclase